jgi:DNA-binding NarL/FixJ family response regulator
LESERLDLEEEIKLLVEKEKDKKRAFEADKKQWKQKIGDLKKIKKELDDAQPQNNPVVKKKLKEERLNLLKLIEKGRKSKDIEEKMEKILEIKKIIDTILACRPEK